MNDKSLNNGLLAITARYNFRKWDELFSKISDGKLIFEYENANRNFEKWISGEQGKADFLLAEMTRHFYIKSTGNTSIRAISKMVTK